MQTTTVLSSVRLRPKPMRCFGDDDAVVGLIVLEVRADRAVPVDLVVPGPHVPRRALERAGHGLAHRRREPLEQILHDTLHDQARRRLRPLRDHARQGHQRGDEVQVRLHRRQHFRLEQQSLHAEPLDRVLLHHADDGAREVLTDVAQPSCGVRRGRAQARAALAGAVVERGHGSVHRQGPAGQREADAVGVMAAEQETPALEALFGIRGRHGTDHQESTGGWARPARLAPGRSRRTRSPRRCRRQLCAPLIFSPICRRSAFSNVENVRRAMGQICSNASRVSPVSHRSIDAEQALVVNQDQPRSREEPFEPGRRFGRVVAARQRQR